MGFNYQLVYNSKFKSIGKRDNKIFILTNFLIIIPAAIGYMVIWMTDPNVLSKTDKITLTVVYSVFFFLSMYYFYKIYYSDPGILPSLYMNSEITSVESKKADNVRDYYIEYLGKNDLAYSMDYKGITNGVSKYYSFNKFRYLRQRFQSDDGSVEAVDKKKKHNKLSYCESCEHLRPPRAFHCSQCGVCVEAHDHHCPYVGNCIGFRNVSIFMAFLFWTATFSLVIIIIIATLLFINVEQMNDTS